MRKLTEEDSDELSHNLKHDTYDRYYFKYPKDKKKRIVIYAICVTFIIMAFIEFILAVSWRHPVGITFSCLMILLSLVGIFVVTTDKWYSTKNRIVKILCYILYFGLGFIILLLMIIHFAGLATPPNVFPSDCGPGHQQNCVRLTNSSNFNIGSNYTPPLFETSKEGAFDYLKNWITSQSRAVILYSVLNDSVYNAPFFHSRFITLFFGFPDDFFTQVVCVNGSAQIWVQSQSREGAGDFGVNLDRVMSFLNYASQFSPANGTCV